MDTPICDFVKNYSVSGALRLHMPGHKGREIIGLESLDITEIDGADVLYSADGIIKKSEENAARLFGTAKTFYSCEGSSLCIRAMVYLAVVYAKANGKKPLILAARNVHKTFMTAAALTDADVIWLYPAGKSGGCLISCPIDAVKLEDMIISNQPAAVYITSPDYTGNTADIERIAGICHKHGCILICDNAHGAYLKFLSGKAHPIELGADICCDSAHKTLPALTGAAYLHISENAPTFFAENAENALSIFASTSPSYLILQSLDRVNGLLNDGLPERLAESCERISGLKKRLISHGYCLFGDEPLKLTLCPKAYGYTGQELAKILLDKGIVCEFSDADFVIMMFSCDTDGEELGLIEKTLLDIEKRKPIHQLPPSVKPGETVLSPRLAVMSPSECIPVREAVGRILASPGVTCPPAVPISVCGERLSEEGIKCMEYYGISECRVVIENINEE